MNTGLERMWLGEVVVCFKVFCPEFAWRDRGKPQKPSVRIVGFWAKT
jgi:hypothetical protein